MFKQLSLLEGIYFQDFLDFVNEQFCNWCSSPKFTLSFFKDLAFIAQIFPDDMVKDPILHHCITFKKVDDFGYCISEIDGSFFGLISSINVDDCIYVLNLIKNSIFYENRCN